MEMLKGKILSYDNEDILNIIKNIPTLDEINITLPNSISKEFQKEIIEFFKFTSFKNMDYQEHVIIEKGALKIKGWMYILKLLNQSQQNMSTSYTYDKSHKKWEDLSNDIIHELLKIGYPYEGLIHVPNEKKTFTRKIKIIGIEKNTYIHNNPFIVGPHIPLNNRLNEYWSPAVNIIIVGQDGTICGPLQDGELYCDYVKNQRIRIDHIITEKMGINNGDLIEVRIFIFPEDGSSYIYLIKPDNTMEILRPYGVYLSSFE